MSAVAALPEASCSSDTASLVMTAEITLPPGQTDRDFAVDAAFDQLGDLAGELIACTESIVGGVGQYRHRGSLHQTYRPLALRQTELPCALTGYDCNQLIASREVQHDFSVDRARIDGGNRSFEFVCAR